MRCIRNNIVRGPTADEQFYRKLWVKTAHPLRSS